MHGQLDMEDLKNFRMNTAHGISHPADAKRRDENIERITAPTRQQEHSKSSEGNDRPADKLQALIQGFKKMTKMVRSQPKHWLTMPMWWQILEMSCERPLKQNQAQEVAQNTPISSRRAQLWRSFVWLNYSQI